jgi:UDP-N-acetyl-D-mannosaminuronic acid transferase (WecB/TagA/CpsF family)
MNKKISFLDIPISPLTKKEITDIILAFAISGKRNFITYLNAHCVNISYSDME